MSRGVSRRGSRGAGEGSALVRGTREACRAPDTRSAYPSSPATASAELMPIRAAELLVARWPPPTAAATARSRARERRRARSRRPPRARPAALARSIVRTTSRSGPPPSAVHEKVMMPDSACRAGVCRAGANASGAASSGSWFKIAVRAAAVRGWGRALARRGARRARPGKPAARRPAFPRGTERASSCARRPSRSGCRR